MNATIPVFSLRKNQFSSFRRPLTSSTSREESRFRILNDWRPSSSQSNDWSSVDSELAVAGTDTSLEDKQSNDSQSEKQSKQSFAVFSSFSFDSRENLTTNIMPTQASSDIEPNFELSSSKMPSVVQKMKSTDGRPNNDYIEVNSNHDSSEQISKDEQSTTSEEGTASNESAPYYYFPTCTAPY